MNAIIEQARSLDGYQDSSELLQRREIAFPKFIPKVKIL